MNEATQMDELVRELKRVCTEADWAALREFTAAVNAALGAPEEK